MNLLTILVMLPQLLLGMSLKPSSTSTISGSELFSHNTALISPQPATFKTLPYAAFATSSTRVSLNSPDSSGRVSRGSGSFIEREGKELRNGSKEANAQRLRKRFDRTAAIVGGVLGGLIGLALLWAFLWFLLNCIGIWRVFH
ncbi:hypothetical protein BDZ45DRAFT_755202 [Acephala macrosclerotiorum]|nr:hypothetical protein BDZ45DRAFT_755202 [Acephala macrosclerotiorum]